MNQQLQSENQTSLLPCPSEEEPTAQDAVNEILGPCIACGGRVWVSSEKESLKQLMTHHRLLRKAPGPARRIAELRWTCRRCDKKSIKDREVLSKSQGRYELARRMIALENIAEIVLECNFAKSEGTLEKRNQANWEKARSWERSSKNQWVWGPPGVGKTWYARCILNRALDLGFTVAEVTAQHWIELSVAFSPYEKKRSRLASVDVLLFEDIDKATWTEQAMDCFHECLSKRHEHDRRLLITSNGEAEFMEEKWLRLCISNPSRTPAITERMMPMERIDFKGKSIRMERQGTLRMEDGELEQ